MTNTNDLIRSLRLMAATGGKITPDHLLTLYAAADRLEELDERVAIMSENDPPDMCDTTIHDDGMIPQQRR